MPLDLQQESTEFTGRELVPFGTIPQPPEPVRLQVEPLGPFLKRKRLAEIEASKEHAPTEQLDNRPKRQHTAESETSGDHAPAEQLANSPDIRGLQEQLKMIWYICSFTARQLSPNDLIVKAKGPEFWFRLCRRQFC